MLFGGALALLLGGCADNGPQPTEEAAPKPEDRTNRFPAAPTAPMGVNDWYRWRGPNLDGVSRETGWSFDWSSRGPERLWKTEVGTGFSSVAVHSGRLFTMGNRNGQDTVFCLETETGDELWNYSYPSALHDKYYEGGPSATPTVDGNAVFTLGKAGDLFCFDAGSGKVVWWKNLAREIGAKTPTWGFAGSPLVEGDRLIVNVGTYGTALDKKTGEVLWTTGKAPSGYATPVPFDLGTTRAVAVFGADAIAGVRLSDGDLLWQHPWKTSYQVNAADPILSGNTVFVSSGYGTGCARIRFQDGDTGVLWKNKELRNQVNSSVLISGHIYGIDGQADDNRPELKCLDFETGTVKWSESLTDNGALIGADGKLILITGMGELVVVEASPSGYKELARAHVIGGKNWTAPVLSNGRIYCRNARGELICLEVR